MDISEWLQSPTCHIIETIESLGSQVEEQGRLLKISIDCTRRHVIIVSDVIHAVNNVSVQLDTTIQKQGEKY